MNGTFRAMLLGAMVWCGAAQNADDVPQLFRHALALQQKGDLAGAVRIYRQILAIRPDVPPAHANLGAALAAQGRYQEAIGHYQAALRGAEDPGTRFDLALAYYKTADFRAAAAQFERVIEAQPRNESAADLAADCYLRLGQNQKVIALLEPLEPRHGDDLTLQYLLGTALIRDHRADQGQRVIARILRRGDSAGADLLLGQAALEAGRYADASAAISKAIAKDATLADGWALSGIAKAGLGDFAAARQAFERALQLDPNHFDANLQLGALMLKDRIMEPAERLTASALRQRPDSPAALYQMGLVDRALGRPADAVKAFEAAEKSSPAWPEPHIQLASLYYRVNRPRDGLRERQTVARLETAQPPK